MPASDFVATILELNRTNRRKTEAQEELELRELILNYFISKPAELALLKEKRLHRKKDGSIWGAGGMEENIAAVKGYLDEEPLIELKRMSAALGLSGGANNNFPIELDGILGFFKPIIGFMFVLFSAGNGGLIGMISRFLRDREVSKNPAIDLNEEEKGSSKYSCLFVDAAAKGNKKYNALYREIIKTADNEEQVLNGMLRYVNSSLKTREASAEAKTRLSEVESVLLGGRSFDSAGVRHICDAVDKNLDAALKLATNGVENLEKKQKIETVKDTFAKLAEKVAERERQLEEDPLTKAKREEFSVFINEHKRKLLHFVVKTQAFAKGETLKPNVVLTRSYIDPKSNAEHDSYFDYWLTKVPSAEPEVESISEDKMIFKQFRRAPTDRKALGAREQLVDVDAYKSAQKKAQDDKFKDFRDQATNASVVVKKLNKHIVGIGKHVESLEEKIQQLHRQANQPGPGIGAGAKSLIKQQIEKMGEQRDSLLIRKIDLENQAKLLQEAIISNVIDVVKGEMELSKARASADGGGVALFNWDLPNKTPEADENEEKRDGRDKIMQALKNSLQIYDFNAPQNQDLKSMVDNSWGKGVSDAIKLRTEFKPQTVNGLFSFLQENSDELLQLSKIAQASLVKTDIFDEHTADPSARHRAFAPFASSRQHP